MSDYARPVTVTYSRAIGAATSQLQWYLCPPPGTSKFKVLDINLSVTTAFAWTVAAPTAPPVVSVGIPSNLSVAGLLSVGVTTTATTGTFAATNLALGWANPITIPTSPINLTGVLNPNATPFLKPYTTQGSVTPIPPTSGATATGVTAAYVAAGTTSAGNVALASGTNNPLVPTIEMVASAYNTVNASGTSVLLNSYGNFASSAEVLGPAIITFNPATASTNTGVGVADVTIAWF